MTIGRFLTGQARGDFVLEKAKEEAKTASAAANGKKTLLIAIFHGDFRGKILRKFFHEAPNHHTHGVA